MADTNPNEERPLEAWLEAFGPFGVLEALPILEALATTLVELHAAGTVHARLGHEHVRVLDRDGTCVLSLPEPWGERENPNLGFTREADLRTLGQLATRLLTGTEPQRNGGPKGPIRPLWLVDPRLPFELSALVHVLVREDARELPRTAAVKERLSLLLAELEGSLPDQQPASAPLEATPATSDLPPRRTTTTTFATADVIAKLLEKSPAQPVAAPVVPWGGPATPISAPADQDLEPVRPKQGRLATQVELPRAKAKRTGTKNAVVAGSPSGSEAAEAHTEPPDEAVLRQDVPAGGASAEAGAPSLGSPGPDADRDVAAATTSEKASRKDAGAEEDAAASRDGAEGAQPSIPVARRGDAVEDDAVATPRAPAQPHVDEDARVATSPGAVAPSDEDDGIVTAPEHLREAAEEDAVTTAPGHRSEAADDDALATTPEHLGQAVEEDAATTAPGHEREPAKDDALATTPEHHREAVEEDAVTTAPGYEREPVEDDALATTPGHAREPVEDDVAATTPGYVPAPVEDDVAATTPGYVPAPVEDDAAATTPGYVPAPVEDDAAATTPGYVPPPVVDDVPATTPGYVPAPVVVDVPATTPDPAREPAEERARRPQLVGDQATALGPDPRGAPRRTPRPRSEGAIPRVRTPSRPRGSEPDEPTRAAPRVATPPRPARSGPARLVVGGAAAEPRPSRAKLIIGGGDAEVRPSRAKLVIGGGEVSDAPVTMRSETQDLALEPWAQPTMQVTMPEDILGPLPGPLRRLGPQTPPAARALPGEIALPRASILFRAAAEARAPANEASPEDDGLEPTRPLEPLPSPDAPWLAEPVHPDERLTPVEILRLVPIWIWALLGALLLGLVLIFSSTEPSDSRVLPEERRMMPGLEE